MADGLQEADEPVFGLALMLVVKRQPVRRAGIGVRPAEFQPVMRPADRLLDGSCGIDAKLRDPGDLARQPFIVVVAESLLQVVERFRQTLLDGRIDDLDPHIAAADLDRIDAQPVAVALVLARLQVELPVVPVAGEQAVAVERPFAQRIALMRAAIVAGADAFDGVEERDLAAIQPEDRPALAAKLFDADGPDPALMHRRASPVAISRNLARFDGMSPHNPSKRAVELDRISARWASVRGVSSTTLRGSGSPMGKG